MPALETLIFVAGLLHFAILIASGLVPIVLDWRRELAAVHPFLRRLLWVYGAFIVLTIIGFGALSLAYAPALAAGSPLARGLCAFIGTFWAARLAVQFFVFDVRSVVRSRVLLAGYHGLTVVFAYFVAAYGYAAFHV